MIGLVVATHARLAEELISACEMIIGPVQNVRAVGICREDSVEEIRSRLSQAVEVVGGDGEGVIIMTDMFGGTPANISLAFLDPSRIEVLTGVNLPMLIRFTQERSRAKVGELALKLKESGIEGITVAGDYLKR